MKLRRVVPVMTLLAVPFLAFVVWALAEIRRVAIIEAQLQDEIDAEQARVDTRPPLRGVPGSHDVTRALIAAIERVPSGFFEPGMDLRVGPRPRARAPALEARLRDLEPVAAAVRSALSATRGEGRRLGVPVGSGALAGRRVPLALAPHFTYSLRA